MQHFRRQRDDRVDLLTAQFDRHGGRRSSNVARLSEPQVPDLTALFRANRHIQHGKDDHPVLG
ncbi:MAG TPA: hypothetical protein VNO24_15120 [Blastocatellia bacterium]|nr:hypothetical protein [Blastocatellia bacterium]